MPISSIPVPPSRSRRSLIFESLWWLVVLPVIVVGLWHCDKHEWIAAKLISAYAWLTQSPAEEGPISIETAMRHEQPPQASDPQLFHDLSMAVLIVMVVATVTLARCRGIVVLKAGFKKDDFG